MFNLQEEEGLMDSPPSSHSRRNPQLLSHTAPSLIFHCTHHICNLE